MPSLKKILHILSHGTAQKISSFLEQLTPEEMNLILEYISLCNVCDRESPDLFVTENGAICVECHDEEDVFELFMPDYL